MRLRARIRAWRKPEKEILSLAGRDVTVSNPRKVYFPRAGITKLELVQYYVAVAPGALRGVARRPQIMKRYVNGVEAEPFFQKRVDAKRPDWIETATFTFPSGRHAEEVVVNDARAARVGGQSRLRRSQSARGAQGGHGSARRATHRSRSGSGHRVAADRRGRAGGPGRLEEMGLVGWPKTSGSRGAHVWVRIEPKWPFDVVRRAALAFAREVERRAPDIATAKWWKEERRGVFLDYNQNARDRTTASAYSVRADAGCARVDAAVVGRLLRREPARLHAEDRPALFAERGDAHAGIDDAAGSLDKLLELADRDEAAGNADAPWPPHFAKAEDEGRGSRLARRPKREKLPVITIARAKQKADALAGLERWKAKYPDVVEKLAPEHVIVDTNRGRATAWYRVRINLQRFRRPSARPRRHRIPTTIRSRSTSARPDR